MATTWNKYQEAIFEAVRTGDENLVVRARAGTGKTTTILGALDHVPRGKKTLLCAFNKSIQTELQSRAPKSVEVKTLHAIGFGVVARGKVKINVNVNQYKTDDIIKDVVFADSGATNHDRVSTLKRLVGLAKNMLANDAAAIEEIANAFDIADEDNTAEELAEQAVRVLNECAQPSNEIDFDDMVWLPARLGLKPKAYDVVFVDEAQDLNAAQRYMVNQLVRDGGRLIAVGDDRQAIYGWRGAGANVLAELVEQFDATLLPLSVTYRCGKAIVAAARDIVPDYEAAPNAHEGEILSRSEAKMLAEVKPGDFILSRANAPLMGVALSLIRNNVPAVVTGRDISKSLSALARKSKKSSIADMLAWCETFRKREAKRLLPKYEAQFETVIDRIECLRVLSEGVASVNALCKQIDTLFSDVEDAKVVTCSTVHKAKGLERDRVYLLSKTFKGDSIESQNIKYVAVTRARKTLVYVE